MVAAFYRWHADMETAVAPWLADMPGLDFEVRRRTPLLAADLAALNEATPLRRAPAQSPSACEALGRMYVLEGSRLGARVPLYGPLNLVVTANRTLSYWDGGAGGRNNGLVEGGTGVWEISGGNDNWTTSDGTLNAPYANGAFAVFAGGSGTVTVDTNAGSVTATHPVNAIC